MMFLALGSALSILLLGFRLDGSWKVLWLGHNYRLLDVSSFDFNDFFLFLVDSLDINLDKGSSLEDFQHDLKFFIGEHGYGISFIILECHLNGVFFEFELFFGKLFNGRKSHLLCVDLD
jgi:hypothetical protein